MTDKSWLAQINWVGVSVFLCLAIIVSSCNYRQAKIGSKAVEAGLIQNQNGHWVRPDDSPQQK